jgi:hypothetical protein
MALHGVFYDAVITINSVVMTTRAKSVTLNYSANMLDASVMGNLTKINLAGLKEWSLTCEFEEDYAASGAGSTDATLFPLIGAAAFTISVLPASGGVGATNPNFTGSAVLESYNPCSGAHGSLHTATAVFRCAGTLSRATA